MAKKAKPKKGLAKPWPPPRGAGPPATANGTCRLHVHFSGNVQGVGLRATAANLAPRFSVTGWVKNTPDGRVEMLVEGKQEDIERYLAALGDEMSTYIRGVTRVWEPPTGEWTLFTVTS